MRCYDFVDGGFFSFSITSRDTVNLTVAYSLTTLCCRNLSYYFNGFFFCFFVVALAFLVISEVPEQSRIPKKNHRRKKIRRKGNHVDCWVGYRALKHLQV